MSVRLFYSPSCSCLQKIHWGYLALKVQSVHTFQGPDCPCISYSVYVSHPGMISLRQSSRYDHSTKRIEVWSASDSRQYVPCPLSALTPEVRFSTRKLHTLTSFVLSAFRQMPQNHCSSNCGTRATTDRPTIVYLYAALIKIPNIKKDKHFNKQTIHKPHIFAKTQHCWPPPCHLVLPVSALLFKYQRKK
jgi:hypothetical protein